ncbi:MAG: hypothetical protein QOG16_811 [Actinomycetota bacterium]|nr:hypothetical protein [Actinomycetota bacterium]
MQIVIEMDESDPPEGHLSSASADGDVGALSPCRVEFVGWLGLLRALSSVVAIESADANGLP